MGVWVCNVNLHSLWCLPRWASVCCIYVLDCKLFTSSGPVVIGRRKTRRKNRYLPCRHHTWSFAGYFNIVHDQQTKSTLPPTTESSTDARHECAEPKEPAVYFARIQGHGRSETLKTNVDTRSGKQIHNQSSAESLNQASIVDQLSNNPGVDTWHQECSQQALSLGYYPRRKPQRRVIIHKLRFLSEPAKNR